MSSKRCSIVNADEPPFDEIVKRIINTKRMKEDLEEQSGPMDLQ